MARQPAILELVGGKSNRQRAWEAIRALHQRTEDGAPFTADEISRKAKVEYDPVRYALKGWVAAGYLQIVQPYLPSGGRNGVKTSYRLALDNGVEAPRVRPNGEAITQGRGAEAMWAAITALDSFRVDFLAEIARVQPNTAKAYCSLLGRAGYLIAQPPEQRGCKGRSAPVWRVSPQHRDSPRAPMITRLKAVYDPNLHRIVWAETADDAVEAIDSGEVL